MLIVPKLEDKYKNYSAGGFAVTNEEPEVFNQLLGKKQFDSAACIASGGEVLLTVLLGRCKEIVAVDHSYRSITACYIKILLLQKLGLKKVLELMEKEAYTELNNTLEKLAKSMPKVLINRVKTAVGGYDWHNVRREFFLLRNSFPSRKTYGSVSFVHGDVIRDLGDKQFDLLYISNALEHTDRDGKAPTLVRFASLVKPGGLLLYTGARIYYNHNKTKEWESIAGVRGYRTQWYHGIMQRTEEPILVQKVQAS